MESELSLVDTLPGLVWTALPDGRSDFLNQRWREYTGLSVEDARGEGWHAAIHPEDLPELLERWGDILASGHARDVEARLRRFDGVYRWFLFSISPLQDASGTIVRWCGINTDIEDRRRAEEALRASERRFRLIFDGLPAIVTLMTPDGELENGNQQMLEYFGATLEELKAREAGYSFHPEDRPEVMARWRRSIETGLPYDVEARLRRADGAYRWFHCRGFPLRDTDGRIVVWHLLQTDVDERKRAEALLAGEKRLLEMVATGQALSATLEELCLLVEALCPDCLSCSILLLDPGTKRLWARGIAQRPQSLYRGDRRLRHRPDVSSCGTAAYEARQTIASDIASDPRWAEFRGVALANGLRACCSTPILSQQKRVLGTFALFSGRPSEPSPAGQAVIALVTHIASIAIERERSRASLTDALDELQKSEGRLQTIIDTIPTSVFSSSPDGVGDFWNQRWHDYAGITHEDAQLGRWEDVIHPDDVAKVADAWGASIATGQPGPDRGAPATFRRRIPLVPVQMGAPARRGQAYCQMVWREHRHR